MLLYDISSASAQMVRQTVRFQERKFYEQFEALPLSAGAGSLFIWDSRTAHQNVMPGTSYASVSQCQSDVEARAFVTWM